MEVKTFRRNALSFEAVELVKDTDIEKLEEYSKKLTDGDSIEGMGWEYRFDNTGVGIMRNGVRAWYSDHEKIAVEGSYNPFWIVFGPCGTFYVVRGLESSDTYSPLKPGGHLHWWEEYPNGHFAKIDEDHLFHIDWNEDTWNQDVYVEYEENGIVVRKSIGDEFNDTVDDAKARAAAFLGQLVAAHFKSQEKSK